MTRATAPVDYSAQSMATSKNLVGTRQHYILDTREAQLTRNQLAVSGGRPYVENRLWRAPNESDQSWSGTSSLVKTSQTPNGPGRKDRAPLLNEAGRISAKINQYLFSTPTRRDGIDAAFSADCTTTGVSVGMFWALVSESYTAGQWVWLQADRGALDMDAEGQPVKRTLAQREAIGDRVRWSMWHSTDVPDWAFDAAGKLAWLITNETRYENTDPLAEPRQITVRTLWRRGGQAGGPALASWYRYEIGEDGEAGEAPTATGTVSSVEIPFIVCGTPSSKPWWFDDVEMIQACLLNLDSLHLESLTRTVYPQMILPASMTTNLEARITERYGTRDGAAITELVKEIIRGMDRPMIESADDKGITRYLMPSATDLEAIPTHRARMATALFEAVGLTLFNRESRQVQSAEAKQFDHLDIEATLAHRAMILQDAEKRLVATSQAIDKTFKTYDPQWPDEFSVPSTAEDISSLTQLANFTTLPAGMRRQVLKAAVRLLGQIETIDDDTRAELLTEIDEEQFELRANTLAAFDERIKAVEAMAPAGGGRTQADGQTAEPPAA